MTEELIEKYNRGLKGWKADWGLHRPDFWKIVEEYFKEQGWRIDNGFNESDIEEVWWDERTQTEIRFFKFSLVISFHRLGVELNIGREESPTTFEHPDWSINELTEREYLIHICLRKMATRFMEYQVEERRKYEKGI